jgi:hypothetical protein
MFADLRNKVGSETVSQFPTRRVDRSQWQSVEPLGTKPKFWFRDGKRRLLFKAEDRGTGEDWAEVVACHLCERLGLPHVEYELAAEYHGEQYIRPGVVCENMAPRPLVLVLGNQLLWAVDPQYPQSQRFKVRQHTVEAVSEIVARLAPPADAWMRRVPTGIESALDVFVGYVMLDAWIANQDRHHENWAALSDSNSLRLAPTFDHGASLARNLLDRERHDRLTTRDQNRTVLAFAERGRSAFYATANDARPLELREAFLAFAQRAPAAAQRWLARLHQVNQEQVWGILARVPAERMSEICRQFTLELLLVNRQRLLE